MVEQRRARSDPSAAARPGLERPAGWLWFNVLSLLVGRRPPDYAVAGVAGMVGGAIGAPVTAAALAFELTFDFRVTIPIVMTAALSYGLRRTLSKESIYTFRAVREGRPIPQTLQADLGQVQCAKEIMQGGVVAVPASTTRGAFAALVLAHPEQSRFVVHEGNCILGTVGRDAAAASGQAEAAQTLGQIASPKFVVAAGATGLADLRRAMSRSGATACLVAANVQTRLLSDIQGIVTDHEIAEAIVNSVDVLND